MKSVEMIEDYYYQAHPRMTVLFRAGITYVRVIEAAAREIEAAEAGRIVHPLNPGGAAGLIVDASDTWRPRR